MDKKLELSTSRYKVSFEEIVKGGPGGYESTYLTSEGEASPNELYNFLDRLDGTFLPSANRMLRTRNGDNLLTALSEGKSLGIASGFKPSGAFHFGHKLASSAVSFFQKNGVQVFMPVADLECMLDTKLSREQYMYFAADNLLDWGANGVNLDAAYVYLQSEEHRVANLAYFLARGLSIDLPIDIYGAQKMIEKFPFLFAGITQVGDICLPQHEDFGNYHSFMVSGQDQDGHMKMTSELVKRALESGIDFGGVQTLPSGLYIPHIRGIIGKASSSEPESTIYLGSGPDSDDLNERISKSLQKLDRASENPTLALQLQYAALDMVRYIEDFNMHSLVDFVELNERIPEQTKTSLGNLNESEALLAIDNYLIEKCNEHSQDNVALVRDVLPEALRNHQQRRQRVLDYALARADYKDPGAWAEDDRPIELEFWKVPSNAVVEEKKMAGPRWFHIVSSMRDKILA
ncbi:MAG: hypothetical protein AABX03_00460 [Nanoarchaeota archaeon]